jgi:hypothetical protein
MGTLQTVLVASGRLRSDGMVIYSEEGTPIQNNEIPLHGVREQLELNGASSENADKFVDDLRLHGVAEIRQPKLITSFSAL